MFVQKFRNIRLIGVISAVTVVHITPCLAAPPDNDLCANATILTGEDYIDYYIDNTEATISSCEAEPTCSPPTAGSLWYRFDPTTDGYAYIYMGGVWGMIPSLAVFNGCAINSAQFGCMQPQMLDCVWGGAVELSVPIEAGESYLIRAASTDGLGEGVFAFLFHSAPPNDHCADATLITSAEFDDVVDVELASSEPCDVSSASCLATPSYNQVWYRYEAQVDGVAIIHTEGSNYNTAIVVYNGCPIQAFGCLQPTELACAADPTENSALMLLPITAGQTYLIKVANLSFITNPEAHETLQFHFGFIPTGAPLNDVCASATLITSNQFNPSPLPVNQAGQTSNEPQENCESGGFGVSNSVFYRFIPAADGLADINTFGSTFDTVLSVFDGCGVMLLPPQGYTQPTLLACNNDAGGIFGSASSIGNLPMQAGQAYVIKVAGNGPTPDSGNMDFNFQFEPQPLCPADVTGNGMVNIEDLLAVIAAWGAPGSSPANVNGDNIVNIADLLAVIAAWGACP